MKIFNIENRDVGKRIGYLKLNHSSVKTPVFMPVATKASVKAVWPHDLISLGYNLILSNTYHLLLRPGLTVINDIGGLHKFMSWKHSILTDSGGFQVFSLSSFRKICDGGVGFRSHIDGKYLFLSPEEVVETQVAFGSDIIMPIDVCVSESAERSEVKRSVELTTCWARQSAKRWYEISSNRAIDKNNLGSIGGLFGIVQGQFYKDLRLESLNELVALDLPGYAVGGLSVGEERNKFIDYLSFVLDFLPTDRPRYVMGIGSPDLILDAIAAGADMFDCVYPTRIARNAQALTTFGRLSMRNSKISRSNDPIDSNCFCRVCQTYTRAYIRHLFNQNEIMAASFLSYHNLAFMSQLITSARESIRQLVFNQFKKCFMEKYLSQDSLN